MPLPRHAGLLPPCRHAAIEGWRYVSGCYVDYCCPPRHYAAVIAESADRACLCYAAAAIAFAGEGLKEELGVRRHAGKAGSSAISLRRHISLRLPFLHCRYYAWRHYVAGYAIIVVDDADMLLFILLIIASSLRAITPRHVYFRHYAR